MPESRKVERTRRPRVSIGLPVYDGETFLEESIDSILGQTFSDFELIVSDNASTDGTREICEAKAAEDSRIRYLRQPENVGAAKNYNLLFHESRGEFFRWAADDDVCEPRYLERCLDAFDRGPPETVLCYPRTILIDARGGEIGTYDDGMDLRSPCPHVRIRELFRRLKLCNAVFGLARSEVLARTGLIGSYISSDVVLLGEMALRGRIHEVPEYLFRRRVHEKMSNLACRNDDELAEWFDPANRGRLPMLRCRLFVEHLRSIWRAPIGLDGKLDASSSLAHHYARRFWRQMGGELKRAVRRGLGLRNDDGATARKKESSR